METSDELAALLRSLAVGPRVRAACGPVAGIPIAERVLDLAERVRADRPAVRGAGPASVPEVAAALDPVNRWEATEMAADIASAELVHGVPLQNRDSARRAAGRIAAILGEDADWFTNREGFWGAGGQWNPVTHHGIDVVVAATNGELFVVLLAFGDD
ncbi:hypothetical protein SAMN05216371_0844 [Streptomyces sp. TLI_053]|uniref:hypothetical protein n=1 Tax=Streptomyces sp. TLI_053 TaxID=1855352 RepID=UPI00087CB5B0|nr:hypothetical protein [Streptomyces sp. TLI_053]SDS89791.1 hypothetical protein SAMN05216371_0844 [Streptomyces sp. TLI_053]